MALHTFTSENFQQEVLESTVVTLVDFWAEWCGPCRILGPIIEEIADEMESATVKIGKLNVDEHGDIASQYHVMSIPTVILFKGGKPVEQFVGVQTKDVLKRKLAAHK